jgi:CHAD domain-containing protein
MARIKLVSGLDCSAPAGEMIRLVLHSQLEAMCKLRDKALDSDDREGVHDMRVFSRRLRSAISDLKPFLKRSNLPRLKLKAIANSLGTVRDEDIALSALEELRVNDESVARGIELFVQDHALKRAQARIALEKVIARKEVKAFRKDFLTTLSAIAIAHRSNSPGELPMTFSQLGVQVVNSRLKEVRAAGRFIYSPFKLNEIHKLRLLAKRLRYAIEMFSVCWGDEAEEAAKEISLLQDSLGKLHDCDVWIERLGKRLAQGSRDVPCDDNQLRRRESAVWLMTYFSVKRTENFGSALARWHQWEATGFLKRLESVIKADASA